MKFNNKNYEIESVPTLLYLCPYITKYTHVNVAPHYQRLTFPFHTYLRKLKKVQTLQITKPCKCQATVGTSCVRETCFRLSILSASRLLQKILQNVFRQLLQY